MFEPCNHCGQCVDEAIGGPLACIVCERGGAMPGKGFWIVLLACWLATVLAVCWGVGKLWR